MALVLPPKQRPAGSIPATVAIYRWRVRTRLPERFGQRCKILVTARRMNSVLVEFEDGYKVVTSRWYVRPERESPGPLFDN